MGTPSTIGIQTQAVSVPTDSLTRRENPALGRVTLRAGQGNHILKCTQTQAVTHSVGLVPVQTWVPRPHLRLDITSGRLRRTFNPQTHEHSPTVSKVPPPETDKHSNALRLVSRHSGQSPLHASTQCPGRDRRVYIPSQNITYPSRLRHTFLFCVSYCCL